MERPTRRFHGAVAVLTSLMLWSDVVFGSMADVVLEPTSDMGRRSLVSKHPVNLEAERRNTRKLEGENSRTRVCSGFPKVPLTIGVPEKDGFEEFLSTSPPYFLCNNNDTRPSTTEQITGCSIDIFKTAMTMRKLQVDPTCYEFCIFKGTYDELVRNVSSVDLNGAVGDVTITSERSKVADFTMTYAQSGADLFASSENDLEPIQWIFVAPLTWQLWFATVGFFFFIGFVVWMIERPRNPEYQGSLWRQINTAIYFAFSTLTFSHDQIIRSPLSRIVVVIWCFVVLIVVQSYTTSLSSLLTAERLRPSVTPLTLQSFSGLFITSGCISFVMLMISLGARLVGAQSIIDGANNNVDEESPRQNGGDGPIVHASENSGIVEESRQIQNVINNSYPVPNQLPNGAISINIPHGGHRRSRSAGHEELRSTRNGADTGHVATRSFRVEMINKAIPPRPPI